jgi:hypothetical protein
MTHYFLLTFIFALFFRAFAEVRLDSPAFLFPNCPPKFVSNAYDLDCIILLLRCFYFYSHKGLLASISGTQISILMPNRWSLLATPETQFP